MTLRTLAALAMFLVITLACQTQDPGQPQEQETGDGATIVALLYGDPVTASELDDWIRGELFERETRGGNPTRVYELRSKNIEKMIAERVIDAEASRLGVTPEELMKQEVDALGGVSEAEIKAFYDENSEQMGGATFESIEPQIRVYLRSKMGSAVVAKLREKANVHILLEPVRFEVAADGPSKGPADASVTIIEFSDFQCPFCKRAVPIIEEILEKYPKDVRFVYRHLPLPSHSRARPAAEAAVCADGQGKFWQYHDAIFEDSRNLSDEDLLRYAGDTGLDIDRFKQCLVSEETKQAVQDDSDAAKAAGISSTPIFLINGVLVSGAKPVAEFVKIIDAELD